MTSIEPTEIESGADEKIVFKKKPRKNLRKRQSSDDEIAEVAQGEPEHCALEEIKERQKLRERPKGISIVGLALGKKMALEEELTIKDPFKAKIGGLVNMQTLKSREIKAEDPYDISIGTQFSAETNKRDEDNEMAKYIEEELAKRKGVQTKTKEQTAEEDAQKYLTPEDAALLALPEHLRKSSSHRSEEMLSNQMLNGIPEVDLGIQSKIQNIEATEEAKQRLRERRNMRDGPSEFVPTNMAVNFTQHNRFNIEDNSDANRRQKQAQNQNPQRNHYNPNGVKRATDDYHFDKFRKHFRKH